MWDLLLKAEMLRQAKRGHFIDLEAPWDSHDAQEMTNYAMTYVKEVEKAYLNYKISMDEMGTTEEDEFKKHILDYGRSRNLGAEPQSIDVNVPIPNKQVKGKGGRRK